MAERLFTSPRRHARPDRELPILLRGQRFSFCSEGRELAAWAYGTGPTILLVHGWEGRGSQLGSLVDPLLDAGYRVVLFDGPAHGDSPGSRADLGSFRAAIVELVRLLGGVEAIVAHSFGAMAASLALRDGLDVERLVYVAPAAWGAEAHTSLADTMGVTEDVMRRFRARLESRTGIDWSGLSVDRIADGLDRPLLVIHDRLDREVPLDNARRLADGWAGALLEETEGLGHRRILRAPEVLARTVQFIGDGSCEAA